MSLLDFVSVLQGTASTERFSNGNTLPLMQLPFGMLAAAPQTRSGNWFFHPDDRCLEGIRLTHQPSPWIGDYGTLCLMPNNGELFREPSKRWSGIRREACVWRPHYMRARFLRYGAVLEAAPSERGTAFELKFEAGAAAGLAIYIPNGNSVISICREKNMLYIENDYAGHGSVPENFRTYFAFRFETAPDWNAAETVGNSGNAACGEGIGDAAIQLCFTGCDRVIFSVSVSYIGKRQAELNLNRELAEKTVAQAAAEAEKIWNKMLSAVPADDIPLEKRSVFYSCLYRTLLFPHSFYEYDEHNSAVHYSTALGRCAEGEMYVDNGAWDVFRTQYPFLAEYYPEKYTRIVRSHIQYYRESGWLPKWLSPGECGVMPGTLIDGIIADAAVRGLLSREDLKEAYEGMKKHALCEGEGNHGRVFTGEYAEKGYIPKERCLKSANLTEDYSYGDFCIATVAKILGYAEDESYFRARSENYRNLFDKSTGFIRGRNADGSFSPDFDPLSWGGEYCEGGAWQNGFFAVHDIAGLASLYGGTEGLIKKLDELFETAPLYRVGSYGQEIHEMTEMASVDLGQFAISNQPSFHLPFIYAALGFPHRTEEILRRTAELFSAEPDGFPGDEDNGSMSAWFLWCCMGRYPLCPGDKNGMVSFKKIYSNRQ